MIEKILNKKKLKKLLFYLSVISLSLLICCLICLLGDGMSILSNKNIAINKTITTRAVLNKNLFNISFLLFLGCNLSCIIINLYLHLKIKT